ncbi:MAG: OmpH family outer membrane protein [Ignavibacteria bacterium]|nr:OmpH family outer membrane protein [Ignavibacteria bacterium]
MRAALLIPVLVLLLPVPSVSQGRIGHVNSEAIFDALPEAQDAQRALDALISQWESELQQKQSEWKKKLDEYDKKKLILTDQSRLDAEAELRRLDNEINDFRTKKFGPNGELFQKQNEVMTPIQNKLFQVLEDIATEDGYDYIFDQSGEILLLYSNEENDLTQVVLERMQAFGK